MIICDHAGRWDQQVVLGVDRSIIFLITILVRARGGEMLFILIYTAINLILGLNGLIGITQIRRQINQEEEVMGEGEAEMQ